LREGTAIKDYEDRYGFMDFLGNMQKK